MAKCKIIQPQEQEEEVLSILTDHFYNHENKQYLSNEPHIVSPSTSYTSNGTTSQGSSYSFPEGARTQLIEQLEATNLSTQSLNSIIGFTLSTRQNEDEQLKYDLLKTAVHSNNSKLEMVQDEWKSYFESFNNELNDNFGTGIIDYSSMLANPGLSQSVVQIPEQAPVFNENVWTSNSKPASPSVSPRTVVQKTNRKKNSSIASLGKDMRVSKKSSIPKRTFRKRSNSTPAVIMQSNGIEPLIRIARPTHNRIAELERRNAYDQMFTTNEEMRSLGKVRAYEERLALEEQRLYEQSCVFEEKRALEMELKMSYERRNAQEVTMRQTFDEIRAQEDIHAQREMLIRQQQQQQQQLQQQLQLQRQRQRQLHHHHQQQQQPPQQQRLRSQHRQPQGPVSIVPHRSQQQLIRNLPADQCGRMRGDNSGGFLQATKRVQRPNQVNNLANANSTENRGKIAISSQKKTYFPVQQLTQAEWTEDACDGALFAGLLLEECQKHQIGMSESQDGPEGEGN
ncbi:hypothetical protein CANCADRAFT_44738 [Tortispora caseinolytica NRRL Y-17796]|uniref:Uncharacterized protein n=1 Tax=Tortispora caseinolytica NRRL Y-17796 TaxID=767744 RepID=A0A1E4THD6_9ASCO|nr:hypothetical protein CANCADRAFT_44738 [Tortispora caseinolytica NRRL Y-17796]